MEQLTEHWLKEIEVRDLMSGDAELVFDNCGIDILIRLWETLPGINIYLSMRSYQAAQKRYIALHYDGQNIKRLAAKVGCSEMFVRETIEGKLSDYLPKKGAAQGLKLDGKEG